MNGLRSELLKYKRTFMGRLIVLIPIFFAVYAFVIQIIMKNNALAEASGNTSTSWTMLLALVFNWWSFLFLPLGMALVASLVASQEKKAGNYRALRSHNISPIMLWVNKIAGMAVYSLLSTLVLLIVVTITGACISGGSIPFAKIFTGCIACWFISLTLIPIQLWVSTWGGTLISMGIGFIGMIVGVIAAPTKYWTIVPWSWAMRFMCPIIGVHPNNVILDSNSPLLNPAIIPGGILVSVVVLLFTLIVTGIWFSRREIQ